MRGETRGFTLVERAGTLVVAPTLLAHATRTSAGLLGWGVRVAGCGDSMSRADGYSSSPMASSRCATPAKRQRGVTLVELMVALSVLAILAVAAMPNMQAIVNAGRLRAAADETVATLQSA